VNRLFEAAVRDHQPPTDRGKAWKLFYATQVASGPPTFMLFANRTLPKASPYRRYLENRVREALGLAGIPVRLVIRRRSG
jgi:GTP-binding protein